MIDFNEGTPDTRLIPYEVLSRAFRRALAISSRANQLGYSNPRGILPIRKSIAAMLNMERGLHVDTENICMVRGSQMGIFVAARVLIRPNDYVVVERLTYLPARDAFESCGASILNVGIDDHGINVDELEKLCKKQQIRAVYVTPHHQFPTTVMMTADRRLRLLMLAEQYDFSIIEDDYDHEFHFSHHPVFPLASSDRSNRVIYVGSLSKVLAPGLRTGYLVSSSDFIDKCVAEVMLIDRQGNPATELAVSELMNSGELKRHIRRTFKIYRERRDVLESQIRSELHAFVDFELPHGGLAFWLRFKNNMSVEGLIERAYLNKVRIQPCSLFSEINAEVQGIRLGFGSLNEDELVEGIQRLKNAF
jgi:GntR family transcriptional regulator/MocR family aminotransferase